ncbi:MAG: NAD-dependent DNA ligase LigA [Candidatus Hydrogenedentales bacterium]
MAELTRSERVAELEKLIVTHQRLYYNAEPAISDEEFDALWTELEDLDPANALLRRIGEDKADGWPKVRHAIPMGSQAKATDPESFEAWANKMKFKKYIVQYKMDGASLEIQYRNGLLVRAVTRGDGTIGDDITPNARRMIGLPDTLPSAFTGGVRGEVLMSRRVHDEKYADKANCRNAANGIMKRKDGIGCEDLAVICYDAMGRVGSPKEADLFGYVDGSADGTSPFANELEKLDWLGRMGFSVVVTRIFENVKEVIDYRGRIMALRPSLEYDIDGLVVKSLDIDEEDLAKPRPEKQIAFKFSPEEAVTRLKAIEWSESGALYTPIGIVDPVRLAGTTVQRANLCNPDMIRSMQLKLGSVVVITKRGEIIPKIETLVENPPGASEIEQPSLCGTCGTTLVDEGTRLYCPNELCPKKELHRVEKWLTILDIRDFGSALVRRLHEAGKVKTIADLYGLTVEEMQGIEHMGKISAQKVLRNLHAVKEVSMAEFIAGFDLENVGLLVADKLVRGGFPTLNALFGATDADLIKIDGIAETMAASIIKGLAAVKDEMKLLLEGGAVRIKESSVVSDREIPGNPIAGKSFCFTGELRSMKRPEAEKKIRDLGGTAKSSVVKDLDFLVTNDPGSGSDKNRKAREYGVTIIGEDELLAMLAASQP